MSLAAHSTQYKKQHTPHNIKNNFMASMGYAWTFRTHEKHEIITGTRALNIYHIIEHFNLFE